MQFKNQPYMSARNRKNFYNDYFHGCFGCEYNVQYKAL